MKKKIFDHTYGYVFAFLYQIPLMFWVSKKFTGIKISNAFKSDIFSLGTIFLLILFLCLFYFYLENNLFKFGLFEMKEKLIPFQFFFKNFKNTFFIEILAYFETFLLFVLVWLLTKSEILKILAQSRNGINFWHGLIFGILMVFLYTMLKKFNLKIFKKFISFESKETEKTAYDYLKLKEDLLGKNISDGFMILFISIVGFGGLILLDTKVLNPFWFWLILYVLMLIFNLVYILIKTSKMHFIYILLGSLPFGFIFSAFLPKK